MHWIDGFLYLGAPLLTLLFWTWIKNPVLVALFTGVTVSVAMHLVIIVIDGYNAYALLNFAFVAIYGFTISSFISAFLWWRQRRRKEAMGQDGSGPQDGPE